MKKHDLRKLLAFLICMVLTMLPLVGCGSNARCLSGTYLGEDDIKSITFKDDGTLYGQGKSVGFDGTYEFINETTIVIHADNGWMKMNFEATLGDDETLVLHDGKDDYTLVKEEGPGIAGSTTSLRVQPSSLNDGKSGGIWVCTGRKAGDSEYRYDYYETGELKDILKRDDKWTVIRHDTYNSDESWSIEYLDSESPYDTSECVLGYMGDLITSAKFSYPSEPRYSCVNTYDYYENTRAKSLDTSINHGYTEETYVCEPNTINTHVLLDKDGLITERHTQWITMEGITSYENYKTYNWNRDDYGRIASVDITEYMEPIDLATASTETWSITQDNHGNIIKASKGSDVVEYTYEYIEAPSSWARTDAAFSFAYFW